MTSITYKLELSLHLYPGAGEMTEWIRALVLQTSGSGIQILSTYIKTTKHSWARL